MSRVKRMSKAEESEDLFQRLTEPVPQGVLGILNNMAVAMVVLVLKQIG